MLRKESFLLLLANVCIHLSLSAKHLSAEMFIPAISVSINMPVTEIPFGGHGAQRSPINFLTYQDGNKVSVSHHVVAGN